MYLCLLELGNKCLTVDIGFICALSIIGFIFLGKYLLEKYQEYILIRSLKNRRMEMAKKGTKKGGKKGMGGRGC